MKAKSRPYAIDVKPYAISRKGQWKVLMTYATKSEAEKAIKGRENEFDVREILDL